MICSLLRQFNMPMKYVFYFTWRTYFYTNIWQWIKSEFQPTCEDRECEKIKSESKKRIKTGRKYRWTFPYRIAWSKNCINTFIPLVEAYRFLTTAVLVTGENDAGYGNQFYVFYITYYLFQAETLQWILKICQST